VGLWFVFIEAILVGAPGKEHSSTEVVTWLELEVLLPLWISEFLRILGIPLLLGKLRRYDICGDFLVFLVAEDPSRRVLFVGITLESLSFFLEICGLLSSHRHDDLTIAVVVEAVCLGIWHLFYVVGIARHISSNRFTGRERLLFRAVPLIIGPQFTVCACQFETDTGRTLWN
jgi:hypothetical protein